MKKVLLIGISGVYNYGCEAIVRGTVNILRSKNKNIQIFYASYRPDDDKRRLTDCEVNIIPIPYKRWTINNILRKLLSFINIEYSYNSYGKTILKGIDEVYSIGGDIYTLDAQNKADLSLALFGDYCLKEGISYYLWGCSVGPFEKNIKALNFYKKHLNNISGIYAREKETIEYLKKINVRTHIELIEDPAFSVATNLKKEKYNSTIKTLGINLSPLSALHFFASLDEAISFQVNWIRTLTEKLNCDIVLIPHVYSDFLLDDDLRYSKQIYSILSKNVKTNISIIDTDPGFIGLKKELIKCDIVLAARMHCAINSIATNTPVVFLAYSNKAIGMSKYIYGSDKYAFELDKVMSINFIDVLREANEKFLSNRRKNE